MKPWVTLTCPKCGETVTVRQGVEVTHARCPKKGLRESAPVYK